MMSTSDCRMIGVADGDWSGQNMTAPDLSFG
jgi:hypothetical protein